MTPQQETPQLNHIRHMESQRGARLFRNNNGVAFTQDGRPVRYGLANDSAQVNRTLKSSDLIGITPVTITPDMVGQVVGVFTAVEVKRPGWKYTGTKREVAQRKFLDLIRGLGGIAKFSTGEEY